MAQMKERMQAKVASNAKARSEQEQTSSKQQIAMTDEELLKLFNSSEKAERTPRGAKPDVSNNTNSNAGKKKKKGKK